MAKLSASFLGVTVEYKVDDLKKKLNDIEKRKTKRVIEEVRNLIPYIKTKIAEKAPGSIAGMIHDLPESNVRTRGFKIFNNPRGTISVSLGLDRKKDRKIIWTNYGTGIHGPFGQPIVPRKAKVLVFEVGGRLIFTKSVKGQKGKFFIERGLEAAKRTVAARIGKVLR